MSTEKTSGGYGVDGAHDHPTEIERRNADLDTGCWPDPDDPSHCVLCGWPMSGSQYCSAKEEPYALFTGDPPPKSR